jgi:hypothetical protein
MWPFKKKDVLPKNMAIVCISKEDHIQLLRSHIALSLLRDMLKESKDGGYYQIKAWELQSLTTATEEIFESTYEEMLAKCISDESGRVKILGSAVQEMDKDKIE